MNDWRVVYWDGVKLCGVIVPSCDAYNLVNYAQSMGVLPSNIINMIRIPQGNQYG